jgi:hypothetical protein
MTRKCPTCKKPLTSIYKSKYDQRTDLIFKDLRFLKCQIKPPVNERVKIKCLKDLTITEENEQSIPCKVKEVKEVKVNKPFKVVVDAFNKAKQTHIPVEY